MRGVAEFAPVPHRLQQEAFVEDAEVASKEEEELALWSTELAATGVFGGNFSQQFCDQDSRVTYFMNCP